MQTPTPPTIPLLRGVLTLIIGRWFRDADDPSVEHREAYIDVWCPNCQAYHQHGWRLGATQPQHRAAHCQAGSPYRETGYMILPWQPGDPESAAHVTPPGTAIVRKTPSRQTSQEHPIARPQQQPPQQTTATIHQAPDAPPGNAHLERRAAGDQAGQLAIAGDRHAGTAAGD